MSALLGLQVAASVALLAGPSWMMWEDAIAHCAAHPEDHRVVEDGRITVAIQCEAAGDLRLAHGGWQWSAIGPMGNGAPLGLVDLPIVATGGNRGHTIAWYQIRGGPIGGAFVRHKIWATGGIEIDVMSRAWVRANPYDAEIPTEVSALAR